MKRLVCFGDSITSGMEGVEASCLTTMLKENLDDWDIINAGISGNNTRDALARIERDVLNYDPDFVTVLFGANDAAFDKMIELEEYTQNLLDITRIITPQKTILISPAPIDEQRQYARTNGVLKEYAEAVESVAITTGCHFIDLFTFMWSYPNYPKLLMSQQNDGLHFGEAGYTLLADLIGDNLKKTEENDDLTEGQLPPIEFYKVLIKLIQSVTL